MPKPSSLRAGHRVVAPGVAALVAVAFAAISACGAPAPSGPAALRLIPDRAEPGASISVDGSGFGPGASGDLAFDGSVVGMPAFLANAAGAFRMALAVPTTAAAGPHTITALDQQGHLRAHATLVVTPGAPGTVPPPSPVASDGSRSSSGASSAPSSSQSLVAAPSSPGLDGIPAFTHVYVIVLENREYDSIIGETETAPYLNALAARYGLATNYDAVGHGIASYLALFSGSTHGIADEGIYDISGQNLFDQIESHGLSWAVFAQNVPGNCFMGPTASGGEDGPGTYVRRHEPAINFRDVSGNPSRCARITDFTHFDPAAANLEVIIPNDCNDMEDCSTAKGDAWLSHFLPRITTSPAFANSLVVITFDEGRTSLGGGGHVATILVGPDVRPHFASDVAHDHYSLLRTIEDAWRLPCLGHACQANNLREFFR